MALHNEEPWSLDAEELTEWYQDNVQEGSSDFDDDCSSVMDSIVSFLQSYPGLNVDKVVKAGSVGKGTTYKDGSDLDCVVFVNNIQPLSKVKHTGRYRRKVLRKQLEKLAAALRQEGNVISARRANNLHLAVHIKVNGRSIKTDLLLTADNLAYQELDDVYETMMRMRDEQRRIYHSCLTPMQIEFVKAKPGSVKELIRLVKYWKAEYLNQKWQGMRGRVPNSYSLELLTIYAWENAGKPKSFDLGQGLKKVLSILAYEISTLKHYWTINYTSETAERGIQSNLCRRYKKQPILLDPANPTNNVFSWYIEGIPEVSRIAQETLQTDLLQEIRLTQSWK